MATLGGLDYFGPSALREAELQRAERLMRERSNDETPSLAVSYNRLEASGIETHQKPTPSSRQSSAKSFRETAATPSSRSSREAAERMVETGDAVIIEERRRRADGDGHTTHRYVRGRMLGKGGFAKVYICTSMDTGKNYAVKIVPKANLVKARARQKVRQKRYDSVDTCLSKLNFFQYVSVTNRDQDSSYTQTRKRLRIQALF